MANKRDDGRSVFLALALVVYFCIPFLMTWLSISLTSMYLAYYDMGFMGANNLGLVLFVAPLLLLVMFGIIAGIARIAAYWRWSRWFAMLLGTFLMFAVGIAAFLQQISDLADYPTLEPQGMTVFLKYYFQKMGQWVGLIKS